MRGRLDSARGLLLDDDLALRFENVSRTYSGVHDERYQPAVSVFARFRERLEGAGNGWGSANGEYDEGDEENDEEDASEIEESLPDEDESANDLVNVSFAVPRGTAVAVVGAPRLVRTLTRVLGGMTSPTSGRIVVRGRVAPSGELAALLTQKDAQARLVARRLASLAGLDFRRRRTYVEAALRLALGEESREAAAARPPRNVLKRVAVAASLGPFADILVVDDLPTLDDHAFPGRCIERVRERLDAGASAVVACRDMDAIVALCAQAVWIDDGGVVEIGPAAEIVDKFRGGLHSVPTPAPALDPRVARRRARRARRLPLRGFDQHAAILSVAAVDERGNSTQVVGPQGEVCIRVSFETVTNASVMAVIRLVGEPTLTFVNETAPLGEGSYVAQLRLPQGSVAPGEYEINAGLVLVHGDERTKVGRRGAAQLRVDRDDEGDVLAAETGSGSPSTAADLSDDAEWSIEHSPE